jgi:CheY-like chemotaxis protein
MWVLELATAAGQRAPVNVMNSVAYHLDPRQDRPTVLVVEDEVLIRLMVADELRKHGFSVVEAASADEAISVLQSSIPVHLLLTDLQLPGNIDGLTLARMVHAKFPTMKIVIASGHWPGSPPRGVADAFFSKPYDMNALAARVRELVADSGHHVDEP